MLSPGVEIQKWPCEQLLIPESEQYQKLSVSHTETTEQQTGKTCSFIATQHVARSHRLTVIIHRNETETRNEKCVQHFLSLNDYSENQEIWDTKQAFIPLYLYGLCFLVKKKKKKLSKKGLYRRHFGNKGKNHTARFCKSLLTHKSRGQSSVLPKPLGEEQIENSHRTCRGLGRHTTRGRQLESWASDERRAIYTQLTSPASLDPVKRHCFQQKYNKSQMGILNVPVNA